MILDKNDAIYGFQSLTGSIHTLENLTDFLETKDVSIPHRFNSHPKMIVIALNSLYVSIPHRFNSHSQAEIQYPIIYVNVSIPHRFNSHTNGVLLTYTFDEFQSLTGSIHTLQIFI